MITYIIRGEWNDSLGEFKYWNSELGWTDLMSATRFNLSVFRTPLPPGASGVVEFHHDRLYTSYSLITVAPPPPEFPQFIWN